MADSDARVAPEVARGNMRRLRWLVPIFLALNLILLAVFALDDSSSTPIQQTWRQSLMAVYSVTSLVLVIALLIAWRMGGQGQSEGLTRVLQGAAPLAFLIFVVVLTAIDQRVTSSINPYLLGCMSISLLLLLPPRTAIGLFAIAYVLLFVSLGWTQNDAAVLLSNRANGFAASVLGLVLSLGLWRRNTQYILLRRELTERNATLEKQKEELVWLATRDALTGLYNRGECLRLAELELMRTQRHGGFTSAIVLDLDFFKAVNDRHGHPAGDKVLVHVARCLLAGVRATDVIGRIGGEEFMVLLPQTDIDSAAGLSYKLRRLLHDSPARINNDLSIAVTASFGVGSMPGGHDGTVAALYAAADNALYDAKRLGRDRVERTEPDASLTPSDYQRMRRH